MARSDEEPMMGGIAGLEHPPQLLERLGGATGAECLEPARELRLAEDAARAGRQREPLGRRGV